MSHGRVFDEPTVYRIRVQGTLPNEWSAWFDGFTIIAQANDVSLLTGSVADQAALHGLLRKIGDLGLPLLSVKREEE